MDKRIRIGVLGVGRGSSMIAFCESARGAEVVAICDKWEEGLSRKKAELNDDKIAYYTSFDDFLGHDMDAVVLANYANEHAPFAILCLEAGKHVFSEVLPVQTLAEAVRLAEAVERTGMVYAYGENYCFMPAPREMRRLYRAGKLGQFEYGEGEYLHNCEPIWDDITYGERDHWRNRMYANFYCTHSIGPLLHITGLRPVSVTGFELPFNERCARMGARAGHTGLEMITLENGAVLKSVHGGGCSRNSIWYSVYGSKGAMESAREMADPQGVSVLYTNLDEREGENANRIRRYEPKDELTEAAARYGHGGSDYYTMHNFLKKLRGNPEADVIDVYEALDMFLPGLLAYRSILQGGAPQRVPDMRDKAVRKFYRHDTACTDPEVAGAQWIPPYSKGEPAVDDAVYQMARQRWKKKQR